MPFEQKDMGGALFKNTRKQSKQPDYKGDCVIGGHKYQIGAWLKEGRTGNKYLALIFSEPWVPPERGEDRENSPNDDLDDDVPF